MDLTDKDVKRFTLVCLIILSAVLAFIVVRPVLLSIIAGLIFAYIFFPVYKKIKEGVKNPTLAAVIISILLLLLIILPIWFLVPILVEQIFQFFQVSQQVDIGTYISQVLPSLSSQFTNQITLSLSGAISRLTSSTLNGLVNLLLNFPAIALHSVLVAFVFFFALRDSEKLGEFASGLSPLNKTQEAKLVTQFKGITEAVVYGQIIIGLAQGILAGIGFLVFGVENAALLSILAVICSIIPVIGPAVVYIPVAAFLLIAGSPAVALIFLAYNVIIVSSVDNLLRPYIVSKKTNLSQVVSLIGMIGGLFVFGILGLILGPLILAYFLTFLQSYKDKSMSSLFAS